MERTAKPVDGVLYEQFLAGDTTAYDQLMIRYGDCLTVYLYGYLHNWQDAEDMMIEAFARIMAKRPRIRENNFKAYLYRTGRNLAFRLSSRNSRSLQFSFEEYDADIEGSELVEDLITGNEQRRILHICLERIEPELREALWLFYFEGLSYKEAAAIMRVNVKRIDHLLTRGKKKVREELAKEGVTDANR